MRCNVASLRNGIKQNIDMIKNFQEIIDLEEKCVAEGDTEPIDITFLKKFNKIQLAALETCEKLIDKHENTLKTLEKEPQKKVAADKQDNGNDSSKKKDSKSPQKKDTIEAMDLFAQFENDANMAQEEASPEIIGEENCEPVNI